ncbi:MAG: insulinase family protein [Elusimicrobia bacterium]|nr:insulinase family protein [Elusimicrobiota bacterium]
MIKTMKIIILSAICYLPASLWSDGLSAICLYSQPNKVQFENGFTLIHLEKKGVGLVTATLFVKGGTLNESDEKAGITHLTSILLPKGTDNRTAEKIALETESLGATISAACSNDFSEVYLVVPSYNFKTSFDIFADIVKNPSFPEQEFEKEKIRTIAGIKAKADSIFQVNYDLFNESMFKNHPYHRPVVGYENTIKSIKISEIPDNYRKNFRPENMILSIVGDIDFKEAGLTVEKHFANIKIIGEDKTDHEKHKQANSRSKPTRSVHRGKFHQAYIFTGFPAPDGSGKEYAVIKVINTILGGGMGSRLFTALREEIGLVYEANSFYPTRKETSAFVLYAGTSKKNLDTVESILKKEIKKLNEINDDELQNAKTYLKGVYILDHRTVQRQSWYLTWWEIIGKGYEYDQKYLEDIDKVTIEDIKTTCKKLFNFDKSVTVIMK